MPKVEFCAEFCAESMKSIIDTVVKTNNLSEEEKLEILSHASNSIKEKVTQICKVKF